MVNTRRDPSGIVGIRGLWSYNYGHAQIEYPPPPPPPSRAARCECRQLLERAESCLQEQEQIFAAFLK